MSYAVTLWCGCRVYVSCHPIRRVAHTRIIERKGDRCPERRHMLGTRLRLWELLPDARQPTPVLEYFGDPEAVPRSRPPAAGARLP